MKILFQSNNKSSSFELHHSDDAWLLEVENSLNITVVSYYQVISSRPVSVVLEASQPNINLHLLSQDDDVS